MKPEIIDPHCEVLLEDIKSIEFKHNIKLPQDYIDFILENNGGDPDPYTFLYKGDISINKLLSSDEYIPITDFYRI